ncbi:MAG: cytidine deaminase [Firmicutes bacterium]|nr:cytidine deaminase [Bacillota bacterium]MBR1989118.1 cytidine deaminase [Bacillota bacterium]MBR3706142.1 cytidine deaminase [Bacillota bacterium]
MNKELYRKAVEMTNMSYAPFSKFRVGAALLAKDGRVFTGCNVENSSFGGTICAERTAFVKAVSEGVKEFDRIAIASSGGEAWPCGICRQFMREFCDDDFVIITGNDEDSLRTYTMKEILPEGFKL